MLRTLRVTQLAHKLPKVSPRSLLDGILESLAILGVEFALDPHHMRLVPVHAHEPRDQELVAELVITVLVRNVFDGMLEQQRIPSRPIDDTIQDVRDHFALYVIHCGQRHVRHGPK
jgi:hypothetical protein